MHYLRESAEPGPPFKVSSMEGLVTGTMLRVALSRLDFELPRLLRNPTYPLHACLNKSPTNIEA